MPIDRSEKNKKGIILPLEGDRKDKFTWNDDDLEIILEKKETKKEEK